MERFGNTRIVPKGFVSMVNEPYAIERVCQDAARELLDKVIVEARKGECTIKLTEEHFDRYNLDAIELRETIEIHPLVRCKDCDCWDTEHSSGRMSLGNYVCICQEWSDVEDHRFVYTAGDEYCSRGERREG